jgi:hypothetical protein
VSDLDCVPQILAISVWVATGDSVLLLPEPRSQALLSLEAELDELCLAFVGDETECVHTPAIDMPEGAYGAMAAHRPEKCVKPGRLLREEVPRAVVSGGSLRYLLVRTWLDGIDQIQKLDSILDEEHGYAVSDDVLKLLKCLELFEPNKHTCRSCPHQCRT